MVRAGGVLSHSHLEYIAVRRSPRAMTLCGPVAKLRQCVDALPTPFPMKLSTGRVIKTQQHWEKMARVRMDQAELAQLVFDGYSTFQAAWGQLMHVASGALEMIREELLEALCNALKGAGSSCKRRKWNVWVSMFLRVTECPMLVQVKDPYGQYTHQTARLNDSLMISLLRDLAKEGFLGREHPSESGLVEANRRLDVWSLLVGAAEWAGLPNHGTSWRTLLCSGVNTVKSAPLPMPVEQLAERGLGQLVWDGTCAAWGELEAAGVAVMNDVTAELEAMREELLERLCERLHGAGGPGNDYASSLRTGMLTKVMESLSKQEELIKQAESQRGPRRTADEHPFHATCVSAIDNLTALQRALPMEFYILQSSRPKHRMESDLQEMKEHLKELLSASSDWGSLWEDESWRKMIIAFEWCDAAADKTEDLCLTPVKNCIQVSQAIKDRHQAIPEETAVKPQVESDIARDINTLKAQYESLKTEHEALKSSLNAQASEAFAHRAWNGHGGLSSASPDSLSSWNVVASGSGGSQTILSTSWISVATSGPCCFLEDAIFKIKKEDGFDFSEAKDLQMGSQVVAENGEILEVKTAPEHHVVHEMVELQTESACLQVSPDHRIVRPDKSAEPRQEASIAVMSSLRKWAANMRQG